MTDFNKHSSELRGLQTSWLVGGPQGAPIAIFLHGFPDSPAAWHSQMVTLADRYRVIAPYVRGAGPSEGSAELRRYGPESLLLDNLEILRIENPAGDLPVVVVGHDLGVEPAWRLAAHLGVRARGLVVLNGLTIRQLVSRLGSVRQALKSWYIYALQLPLVPALAGSLGSSLIGQLAARAGRRSGSSADDLPIREAIRAPVMQYRAFFRSIPQIMRDDGSYRLRCPVQVIWGINDPFLEVPAAGEFELWAEDVRFRLLQCGHWVHEEKPEAVNAQMREFLDEVMPC